MRSGGREGEREEENERSKRRSTRLVLPKRGERVYGLDRSIRDEWRDK